MEEAGSSQEPEDTPQPEVSPKEVWPSDESKEDTSVPTKKARRTSRGEIYGLTWSPVLGPPDMSGVTSRSNSRSLRPVKPTSLNSEEFESGVPVESSPGKEKVKSNEKKKRTFRSEGSRSLMELLEEFEKTTLDKLSHPPEGDQQDLLFVKLDKLE